MSLPRRVRRRRHKVFHGVHRYQAMSGEDEWVAEAVYKGKLGGFYVDVG